MNTHTGYRAYVCKSCGLGFSQKSSLKTHEVTHERKEPITCDQCGKIFLSKQALNFHIKNHEGNYRLVFKIFVFLLQKFCNNFILIYFILYRYACDVCNKQFVRKCHYDLHILSHSSERPFKCMKCSMTYKTNKHLRDHIRKAHQDETNFSLLMNSIYADDDVISQQSLIDEYIPPINPLESELTFSKT